MLTYIEILLINTFPNMKNDIFTTHKLQSSTTKKTGGSWCTSEHLELYKSIPPITKLNLKIRISSQFISFTNPTKKRTSAQPASSPLHASSSQRHPASSPSGLPSASRSSSSPPPERRWRLDAEVDADATPTIYSRGSVPGEALEVYTTTLIKFLRRKDHKLSLAKFLKVEKIPESSFYRKRRIAELMILDSSRFDHLVKQLTRTQVR